MSPEAAGQRDGRYSVAEATRLKEHARGSCPREREREGGSAGEKVSALFAILPFTRSPSVTSPRPILPRPLTTESAENTRIELSVPTEKTANFLQYIFHRTIHRYSDINPYQNQDGVFLHVTFIHSMDTRSISLSKTVWFSISARDHVAPRQDCARDHRSCVNIIVCGFCRISFSQSDEFERLNGNTTRLRVP